MSKTNSNRKSAKVNMRFEHELIEAVERCKDPKMSFSAYVKLAVKEKIEIENGIVVDDIIASEKIKKNEIKKEIKKEQKLEQIRFIIESLKDTMKGTNL